MKSVQIQSFFWPAFSRIQTEYGGLPSKSPYSVQMLENTNQKKLRIWTLFTQRKRISAHSYGYDQYFLVKYIYFYRTMCANTI